MEKKQFKTLIFTDLRSRALGTYAVPMDNFEGKGGYGWGGTATPDLMPMTATMKLLKKLYPGINTRNIKLITVELTHTE